MRNSVNLPKKLQLEVYSYAAYLLNRSPIRSLKWLIPIGFVEQYLGNLVLKPSLNYLVPYGCRAYAYIKKQLKLEARLNYRAYIRYLVGYDSTNIFRIWHPKANTIISIRDVIFDMTKRYSPTENQLEATPEIVQTLQKLSLEVSDIVDEQETLAPLLTYETTIEKHGDTIIVEDQDNDQLVARTLPTLRDSPEPSQVATTLPATGLQPTEESSSTLTEPESTDILDQIDVVEELISRELASILILILTLPNLERPINLFTYPNQELKTGIIKGASTSNII